MELFGKDMIIGDFKLSDYGLILASFDTDTNEELELGMDYEIKEEYIGSNPVPIYLGANYTNKLHPQMTIIKDPCYGDTAFTEHECREILRQLTGFRGYKRMQIYSDDFDELLYFNIRIKNVQYKWIGGKIQGIILSGECDSQFAWSKDFSYTYNISANNQIVFYNISDDLYNYLLPKITIVVKEKIDQLDIVNLSDNNWTTSFFNLKSGEVITMDCKNEILSSSDNNRIILNDFNMHFIRLVAGKNTLKVNGDITLKIEFVVPRKVGFI